MEGKPVVDMGSYYLVGDGLSINVVTDPWLPSQSGFVFPQPIYSRIFGLKVGDLIDRDNRTWNESFLLDSFPRYLVNDILKIPIANNGGFDKLIWNETHDGCFNVKLAHFLARQLLSKPCPSRVDRRATWHSLWSSSLVPRIKIFIWKILHNIFPCALRGMEVNSICRVCGDFEESSEHVLLSCVFTKAVWSMIHPSFSDYISSLTGVISWFDIIDHAVQNNILNIVGCTLWNIWKNRNMANFELSTFAPLAIIEIIRKTFF